MNRQREEAVFAQVSWSVNATTIVWTVTVLGILVCGILYLTFRDRD